MAERTLSSVFSKYQPLNKGQSDVFEKAYGVSVRGDRDKKMYEVSFSYPTPIKKKILHELEDNLKEFYEMAYVKLMPKYPSELFSAEYIPEVLEEAKRCGIGLKGFLKDYNINFDGETVSIALPFESSAGIIIDLAKAAEVVSGIIRSEFSLEFKVEFSYLSGNMSEEEFFERRAAEERAMYEAYERQMKEQAAMKKAEELENGEEKLHLERVESLFDGESTVDYVDETTVKTGKMTFDLSETEILIGNSFEIKNIAPLRTACNKRGSVVAVGEIFKFEEKELRGGDKFSVSVGITDKDASAYVRTVIEAEKLDEYKGKFKPGASVAVKGVVKPESKFSEELIIGLTDALKIKRIRRKDNAETKRVELHLHTNMSEADALIKPEEAVMTAYNWGHPAVAITDHGNLQGYPTAMLTAKKLENFKVIYGIEAYFVDDTARVVYGPCSETFDGEFIVFDLETTGLSFQNDRITEIGAVKVKKGKVIDKFNMLVDPEMEISEKITELTGITNEMVKGQPKIDEALPKFLEFVGDRLLIAHNANFDTGFVRRAAERLHIRFENSYLDTVAMSHYVNAELSKHKLDTLAKYFDLGSFNHHRASDDAEMLSLIFYKMIDKLRDEGIDNFTHMTEVMSEKSDPLKLRTYHQIILVKNLTGLRNLYVLVSDSFLKYFRRTPRFPKSNIEEYREGLIIGSACEAGELYQAILQGKGETEIDEIASFYDYYEIQPISNNSFMIENGTVANEEELREINRRIVELGKKHGKPVVATCDAHYLDPEDEIYRRILLSGKKFKDADRETALYFRTTEEMLEEFRYLGDQTAREVVIDNPRKIADMIEKIKPIPDGEFPPHIEGAEEELTNKCYNMAKEMYGDPLPVQVSSRLERELGSIIKNGFAIMYIIAKKLVENSEAAGYQVGSRGSVGSSFAACMGGITKVNSLPPHYRCPECKYSEFIEGGVVGSGFDLPEKNCPNCGCELIRDGHDIPFETFLGFYGDKTPDIDLNFSGDVQADAHKFTEVLFGKGHAFRAGTIGTLADKTAYGLTVKYLEEKGITLSKAEIDRLVTGCVGTKRTTGQHPGGIIVVPQEHEIYDFTPVQHPAGDPTIVTTHFEFKYLHDTILKLDILGHDIPTKYKRLEEYTNTDILKVPLSDKNVYRLFTSPEPLGVTTEQLKGVETGSLGLPEMSTPFVRGVLIKAQPKTFADLLQISGLTHGTNVWLGNAEELIANNICTISEVIGTRDDIMLYLIQKHDLEKSTAFKIMEDVRKGKGLKPEYEEMMIEHGVPDWYIESCKKIKYMFPKAHAAAYVIDALRLGWYKIYHPMQFYAAYFTAAPGGCDATYIMKGKDYIYRVLDDLNKIKSDPGATQKDKELFNAMQLVNECYQRGIDFLPVSVKKSHATKFLPEDGKIRLPFISLPGLGENAAINIMNARDEGKIHCIEDLKTEAKVGKTLLELLRENGALDGMNPTNQMSLFDLM